MYGTWILIVLKSILCCANEWRGMRTVGDGHSAQVKQRNFRLSATGRIVSEHSIGG